ncbi:hypothetical protein [Streptacidiphilus carbonis]|nr:hypothetical protein [Streptacidiphilus carbonis]
MALDAADLFDLDVEFVAMSGDTDLSALSTPTSDGSACYNSMCCNSNWGC